MSRSLIPTPVPPSSYRMSSATPGGKKPTSKKMHETEARPWNPPLDQATQGVRGQKMYIVFLADLKIPI